MLNKILISMSLFISVQAGDLTCEDLSSLNSINSCTEQARMMFISGKQNQAIELMSNVCDKGGVEACTFLIEHNLRGNKIPAALDYLAKYLKLNDHFPLFAHMIENERYAVLFSDKRIPEVLDYGNKYFLCTKGGPAQHYNGFKYQEQYSWDKEVKRFFPDLNSEDLSVNGYLSFYMKGDMNETLKYASDMAQNQSPVVKRLGLKLAAIIYSGFDFTPEATEYCRSMAKSLASRAKALGSKADFLPEMEKTGTLPADYCTKNILR